MAVLKSLMQELETTLPKMGLDDDQEGYLIKRVDQAIVETFQILDSSEESQAAFDKVVQVLHQLIDEQRQVVDEIVIHAEDDLSESAPPTNSGDVELF